MPLPRQATICVRTNESEWRFEWRDFDGDDCFASFKMAVKDRGVTRHFDFGAAVVWSLRWLNRFFENKTLEKTQGGLEVYRHGQDYPLVLDAGGGQEEFRLQAPEVLLDREFLPRYDEDKT